MRLHFLISAAQFLFVLGLVILGGFLLFAAHSPSLQAEIAKWTPQLLNYAGFGCLIVGIGLLFGFYALNQGSTYQLQIGAHVAQIEEAIIQEYVKKFWAEELPTRTISCDVVIHRDQKIEIIAEMPAMSTEQHIELSEKVEQKLAKLLKRKLGYKRDFLFTVLMK